jgi:hypothetical protein
MGIRGSLRKTGDDILGLSNDWHYLKRYALKLSTQHSPERYLVECTIVEVLVNCDGIAVKPLQDIILLMVISPNVNINDPLKPIQKCHQLSPEVPHLNASIGHYLNLTFRQITENNYAIGLVFKHSVIW